MQGNAMAKKRRGQAVSEVEAPNFWHRLFPWNQVGPASPNKDAALASPPPPSSALARIREWTDAIVIATLVAMMVRTFVVEPFKIPSGSMTPELLGDFVAEGVAEGRDGRPATWLLVLTQRQIPSPVQVYRKEQSTGYWRYEGRVPFAALSYSQQQLIQQKGRIEEHRILVNRFAYWFSSPKRGDVAIFRVPFGMKERVFTLNGVSRPVRAFNRSQPVYVKRVVGLPGEEVTILGNQNRLSINGHVLDSPPPFDHIDYFLPPDTTMWSCKLGPGEYALFGDNSDNSEDSRYWGPVRHERLRGKAFLVYWPWKRMKFL
jgi:signal peptidase I